MRSEKDGMQLLKTYRDLLAEAAAEVETLTAEEVLASYPDEDVLVVDVRESAELLEEGRIPGSLHAPRGNLEFWVDPSSPFHRPELAAGKRLILHCAGGWRSALAAQSLQRMGVPRVAHMKGGMTAWKAAGGPTTGAAPAPGMRVTGLGGVFFKCRDTAALKAWYARHLGLPMDDYGCMFPWKELHGAGDTGYTVWSAMKDSTDYFSPSSRQYMINYRVADLPALLAALEAEGVTQVGTMEDEPNGRFAWILDPEGNKIELWEPVPSTKDPYL